MPKQVAGLDFFFFLSAINQVPALYITYNSPLYFPVNLPALPAAIVPYLVVAADGTAGLLQPSCERNKNSGLTMFIAIFFSFARLANR